MKSTKPVKLIEEVLGKKIFNIPNELSNERLSTGEKCIVLGINGVNHTILTGKNVELTQQEFSILKDSGIISPNRMYSIEKEFDPIRHYA